MMNKETAEALAKAVDEMFESRIEAFKESIKQIPLHTPQYDMINSMKRTFGFMRKKYAKYRSMLYLNILYGQSDPDHPDQWALIIRTDIDQALGNPSSPQELFVIESSVEEGVTMDMRYAAMDHDDVFMNAFESCTNSIPDDTLLALNFVSFLSKVRYNVSECRIDQTPSGKVIVMSLSKPTKDKRSGMSNVIRLRYNVNVPLENAQKNIEFIHKCQTMPTMH